MSISDVLDALATLINALATFDDVTFSDIVCLFLLIYFTMSVRKEYRSSLSGTLMPAVLLLIMAGAFAGCRVMVNFVRTESPNPASISSHLLQGLGF